MAALTDAQRFALYRFLGPNVVENDAERRLAVYGTVDAVAYQMLGELRAELLNSPAKLNAAGDISADWTENLRRIDLDLADLRARLVAAAADLNDDALALIEDEPTVSITQITAGPTLRPDGR